MRDKRANYGVCKANFVLAQKETKNVSHMSPKSGQRVLKTKENPNKAYSFGQRLGPNHAQGPIHGSHSPSSPSPSGGPITRSVLKKIQLGFIQDGLNPLELLTLFTLAKEDMKI